MGGQDALGVQLLEPDGTSQPYAHCPAQVADTDEGRSQNNQCGPGATAHLEVCWELQETAEPATAPLLKGW